MAIAAFSGPVIAIYVARKLDQSKVRYEMKLNIYRTLMITRTTPLSRNHLDALNIIDVDFYKDKKVKKSWKIYLEHLGVQYKDNNEWHKKRSDLFSDLLIVMGNSLGYKNIDKTNINNYQYYPQSEFNNEQDFQDIKDGLKAILNNGKPLNMQIIND